MVIRFQRIEEDENGKKKAANSFFGSSKKRRKRGLGHAFLASLKQPLRTQMR
jgi:hypothetical protein